MSTTDSSTGSGASTGIFIEARKVKYAGMSTGAWHLYLVYRDTNNEEYVIRSGPQYPSFPLVGDMKIETNVRMQNSADYRPFGDAAARYSKPLDFPGLTDDQAWAIMVKYARMIDAANTNYELFEENSNAFVGALLKAAGANPLDTSMLPWGVSTSEAVGLKYYTDLMRKVTAPTDGVVYGTEGADTITGIQIAEVIHGYGGNDVVSAGRGNDQVDGGTGSDRIIGGVGQDLLTGGLGDDAFQFNSASEGGDIITDFGNVSGNNDLFRISAAGFGGGLVAGRTLSSWQFQSRADNLAQDADDRFIFRTTDQTLWFDSNGNGEGGLTLVADLHEGAVVVSADILLV